MRTKIRYARDDYRTAKVVSYNQKETNKHINEWKNLSLEGETVMERWLTSPRSAKLKENIKNEEV
jgi:hypothetical protein